MSPGGNGMFRRLRGTPIMTADLVLGLMLSTIIVSVRAPLRDGPASDPSSSTVKRPSRPREGDGPARVIVGVALGVGVEDGLDSVALGVGVGSGSGTTG